MKCTTSVSVKQGNGRADLRVSVAVQNDDGSGFADGSNNYGWDYEEGGRFPQLRQFFAPVISAASTKFESSKPASADVSDTSIDAEAGWDVIWARVFSYDRSEQGQMWRCLKDVQEEIWGAIVDKGDAMDQERESNPDA